MTERSGRLVTEKDLLGKVWVASFVFTRCPGPCPAVTATVAQLQPDLADLPDVRFVTFTVDPARDNPVELSKYADRYKADPNRWLFLTGDEQILHKLLQDRFKQSVGDAPGPETQPGTEFASHSTRLAIVDAKGVIRGVYDGIISPDYPDAEARFQDELKRLKQKVRILAGQIADRK